MISNSTHTLSSNFANAGEAYKINLSEKRDNAVVTAVNVSNANHKQQTADIYISSLDDSSETINSSSNSVDPYDAYRTSMKYQNRTELVSALEKAGDGDFQPPTIDLMV